MDSGLQYMDARLILCILAVASLAGCADDDPSPTANSVELPEPETVLRYANETIDVFWALGVGTPVTGGLVYVLTTNGGEFRAGEGADITAVADWTCAGVPCDMILRIYRNGEFVEETVGAAPLEIELTDAPGGGWAASLSATTPTAAVEGTISTYASWEEPVEGSTDEETE